MNTYRHQNSSDSMWLSKGLGHKHRVISNLHYVRTAISAHWGAEYMLECPWLLETAVPHRALTQEVTAREVAFPTPAMALIVHSVPCPTARMLPSATRYITLLARMSLLQLSNQLLANTCTACAYREHEGAHAAWIRVHTPSKMRATVLRVMLNTYTCLSTWVIAHM